MAVAILLLPAILYTVVCARDHSTRLASLFRHPAAIFAGPLSRGCLFIWAHLHQHVINLIAISFVIKDAFVKSTEATGGQHRHASADITTGPLNGVIRLREAL